MKGMKKVFLSVVLIIALLLVPGVIYATNESTAETAVAQIVGGDTYTSLADAVKAVPTDNKEVIIKLLKTVKDGPGIVTVAGQNVIIDFGGFSYDASNPTVGSDGTETLSCQLNKGSTVTFKNGTFITTKAKMLIQNYANLTVEDMVLDATQSVNTSDNKCYGISNNCGTVSVIGKTSITSKGWPAIDVCWAPNKGYAEGTQVTVNTTGIITGDIELSIWGDVTEAQKKDVKSTLVIENINHDGEINIAEDYLEKQITVKGGSYTDLADAVKAVQTNNEEVTIKLLKDVEDGPGIVTVAGQNVVIDFGGFSYDASNPTVGSDGTKTLSCQLNKGSTVTFKNGTFITTKAKMLIQNYANLTVENMVLDATESKNDSGDKCYGISNNCGTVKIIGKTDIISKGWPAIDVCWAPNKGYPEGTQVTVNTTGKVVGDIELSIWGNVTEAQKKDVKSTLVIENINHDGDINIAEDYLEEQITIKGGTYTSDVSDYIGEGYFAGKQSNGTYLVKQIVDMADVNITAISDKLYTGKELKQDITVKYNGVELKEGTDYTIKYEQNTGVGTAKVIITGKGYYKGTVTKTFKINPLSIKNIKVTGISNKTYTGKGLTQGITVTLDGKTLKNGTDYTVSYSNNTKPGKATVVIEGKGIYEGTITKTFLITPKKLTGLKVSDKTTSKIKLSWSKHEGVAGYKVYSYNSSKKIWEYVGKTDKTSYTIENLKEATIYEYRVRAYKNIDGTQYFGAYSTNVKTATQPKTPSVKVKAGDRKVTFTWNKVSGASGYRIYMATSKNGKYERIKTISNNNTFEYTKSGLKANTKYYFKVRAYKTVDDEKVFSSYTKVLTATTKKVHVVKKGNTLYSIAKKYKTTVTKLTKINNLKKSSIIRIGLRLLLN